MALNSAFYPLNAVVKQGQKECKSLSRPSLSKKIVVYLHTFYISNFISYCTSILQQQENLLSPSLIPQTAKFHSFHYNIINEIQTLNATQTLSLRATITQYTYLIRVLRKTQTTTNKQRQQSLNLNTEQTRARTEDSPHMRSVPLSPS